MVLSKAVQTVQKITTRNMSLAQDLRYFRWSGMKKKYEVLPLVVIIGGAMIGMCGFIGYASKTRVDISFNRKNPQICEAMDMGNPTVTKIRVVNQEYKPMPELKAALDAITE